ncbi:cysteine-rich receptor-like protein kinase 2 isoform X2 [Rutidosis leptorrhynchoides]|uniref:cysteine-rich receptor-like protein kinase 2 isoform X2 n=1 Tax=Rutidosis leptorrhynchoides TaxID=125765 RepID=UPI003A9A270B
MKGAARLVITINIIILVSVYRSEGGNPGSNIISLKCNNRTMNNQIDYISNFVVSMGKISTQMKSSLSGTASTGKEPDRVYGLSECYGDMSSNDCMICYAEASTVIPRCFPGTGGTVFLDGCFTRTDNYSFYQEYARPDDDKVICGNTTRSSAFRDSVRQAISDSVRDAPRNENYFAQNTVLSDTPNESVYVLADCWNTLDPTSCTQCLDTAFSSILKCFPLSEGRALQTGCIIRYSNINFLNPETNEGNETGGNDISKVVQQTCKNTHMTRAASISNFVQAMEEVKNKMGSHFGTAVIRQALEDSSSVYALGQCYGDISTSECQLCYTIARTSIPGCLPRTGGRTYLNGCFLRYENYRFFGEYTGQEDRHICPNTTRRNNGFERSVLKAVYQAVDLVPKTKNYQVQSSNTENNSVTVVAECWLTLDADSCGNCLQKAATSILDCLPLSEGYALFTGCFMRYYESKLSKPDHMGIFKRKKRAIVMAISSVVAFLVGTIIAFYVWKRRSNSRRKGTDNAKLLKTLNSSSLNFKYSTIEKATSSFNEANKLGQGGFGTVYKGVLPDGRDIAVKRLFLNHRHRAGDFYNEVNIISSVDHKNLVKLIGFSCLGPESVLIYEYLSNRSLDHFIFDAVRGKELYWEKRYKIIVGTAEGLVYLHENSKTRIIHRDIKAANILLDSRLNAKIADFGLARSFQQDKNHISTGIAGTLGYMAPEYIAHGQLTEKVDVYSFGVLLLEVVTGMPNRGIQTTSEYTDSLITIKAFVHSNNSITQRHGSILIKVQ